MGRNKAFLPVDGVPMALKVARALTEGGCAPVSLVGKDPSLQKLGLPVVIEQALEYHPLYGVAAALERACGTMVLVAACDLAWLDGSTVARLLAVDGPCVATPEGGGRAALLAVLPAGHARLAADLARANAPFSALTENLERVVLPAPRLKNANRPQDLVGAGEVD